MIELVFTVCLATAPDNCQTKALQYAENITPMACLMGAQPHLAQWAAAHPKWRITGWKCQRLQFAEREA